MLAAAEREAEAILGEAQERQTQLVVEHELTGQAELASEDIIDNARAEEREIRMGAEDYADEILGTFEVNLSRFIAAVRRGRERLQGPDEAAGSRVTRTRSAQSTSSLARGRPGWAWLTTTVGSWRLSLRGAAASAGPQAGGAGVAPRHQADARTAGVARSALTSAAGSRLPSDAGLSRRKGMMPALFDCLDLARTLAVALGILWFVAYAYVRLFSNFGLVRWPGVAARSGPRVRAALGTELPARRRDGGMVMFARLARRVGRTPRTARCGEQLAPLEGGGPARSGRRRAGAGCRRFLVLVLVVRQVGRQPLDQGRNMRRLGDLVACAPKAFGHLNAPD